MGPNQTGLENMIRFKFPFIDMEKYNQIDVAVTVASKSYFSKKRKKQEEKKRKNQEAKRGKYVQYFTLLCKLLRPPP